jgi:ADP-ribose pyrophosphatase
MEHGLQGFLSGGAAAFTGTGQGYKRLILNGKTDICFHGGFLLYFGYTKIAAAGRTGAMELFEKTVEKKTLYRGRIVNVRVDSVALHNGKIVTREVVEHPGGVAVLPYDEDGTVTLVRQYRYPAQEVLLEAPAGKLEPGEDPEICGRRELHEEAGFTAKSFERLVVMQPSPGYCQELLYLYLARDLTFVGLKPDENEFLDIVKLPFSEALQMASNGQITDAKTALAILMTARKLNL